MVADAEDLPARIGAYPVRGLIGTGSMGVVYLGHDPVIDRPVAIKTIHRQLLEAPGHEENLSARFRIEAQAAGRLSHRNIVSVYQFGEDAASAYIVMEYVAGHSLRDYLKRPERFTKAEILCLMAQLLDALQFAHERGVVHRDIKPANLIVADDGRLKISDFGIARMESSQVTRINAVVGSPGYIAPEQYTAGTQDARVDVFAAGVLLYQLLTGTLPFSGTDESIMYQIVYEPHQSAVARSGDQTLAAYEDVLTAALAKDPAKRFANARAFLEALKKVGTEPLAEVLERSRLLPPRDLAFRNRTPGERRRAGGERSPAPALAAGPDSGSGGSSGSSSSGAGSHPSVPVPTGWDDAELAGLEKELARHVGPVARVLVRRAARGQTDLFAVRQAVAGAIADSAARERFIAGRDGGSSGGSRSGSGSSPSRFGASSFADTRPATQPGSGGGQGALRPDDVDKAAAALARRLGPIAKVVARQCAAKAATREQFVANVLSQLAAGVDANAVQAELWRALS